MPAGHIRLPPSTAYVPHKQQNLSLDDYYKVPCGKRKQACAIVIMFTLLDKISRHSAVISAHGHYLTHRSLPKTRSARSVDFKFLSIQFISSKSSDAQDVGSYDRLRYRLQKVDDMQPSL